jgi:SAM-dependent methyltransferase
MSESKFGTWESAVEWLLKKPEFEELVRACYYDRPALAAAQRYHASPEWGALRQVFPRTKGKALDVGAGMGIASYALAMDGWVTSALEPDPSELVGAAAIESLAEQAGLRINVVREWGEKLPFDTGAFDLVHARQVLHHARDLEQFCMELSRVLVPDGMLVATREHVISSIDQLEAFQAKHPLHSLYGGENAFTAKQYRDALNRAGLRIVQEFGPLDSVINLAPLSQDDVCEMILARASKYPFGGSVAKLAVGPGLREGTLALLSRLDRRPGRLHTFVCKKATK